jgi:hypothetical protein
MDDKLKKYEDRAIRWQETALSQMGYTNNIILTLTLAFLAFAFNDKTIPTISFSNNSASHLKLCFHISSVVFLMLSVLFGVATSLFRLSDFRITRYITLTRKRYYECAVKEEKHSKYLSAKSFNHPKFCQQCQTAFRGLFNNLNRIDKIEATSNLNKDKFAKLREESHITGIISWHCIRFQFYCLVIGITLYSCNLIF